ncbi:DUF2516 family protein [Leekyejoonella antrihumi]|uniref:DUF2516 family protein n=1 Tax=Leekyejoonella antrihumi TaxID=1660198 RepID=A0A563E8Q2_9MICO|nr:DUF2516 family protein [Leekyejoonella antrihumi]TWP38887.1 DUF2516 family protein [Leekyejoonella antrihumi]
MLDGLWQVQSLVAFVLGIVLFAMEVFALIEAVRPRSEAYVAAGKLTKPIWMAITAVCAVLGLLTISNPLNLFGVLAVVGAAIFLADVRPALHRMLGQGKKSRSNPFDRW